MLTEAARAHERALLLLSPLLDIVNGRVDDATVPDWCERRGWTEFLLALDAATLQRCEAHGLTPLLAELDEAPESLRELAREILEITRLPRLTGPGVEATRAELRGVSARKRAQLSMLLSTLAPMALPAARIVDVGAGSGHFTRLAAEHFTRATLGLERSPERVARARERVAETAAAGEPLARFIVLDADRDSLSLAADDLAIGLHACGDLGDTLVKVVARSGADLALVSCCLQKISAPERVPLSARGAGLSLRRESLGLSNLTSQAVGVESRIEQTMLARQARYALRSLLRERGLELEPGAEMHGINRRRAHAGLADIAGRALSQRGLPEATIAELAQHEQTAARHYEVVRRLSLPRNALARVIELCVVLDRAACLEESGHAVTVATVFERAVTPRNICLFASRTRTRLPPTTALG